MFLGVARWLTCAIALSSTVACGSRTELPIADEHEEPETETCKQDCPVCGDSRVEGSETCDDGNSLPGDGCSARCRWEPVAIGCGINHTCALGANGQVKCWGSNTLGSLGLGDTNNRGDQPREMGDHLPALDLGQGRHVLKLAEQGASCALLDDHSLKCWGMNDAGQLGLGDIQNRGDEPGEMGDALPAVDLGTGHFARSVSRGRFGTCAILEDDSLKCWAQTSEPQHHGNMPGEMGDANPNIRFGERWRVRAALPSGDNQVCALLAEGDVKCWGGWGGPSDVGQRGTGGQLQPQPPAEPLSVNLGTGRTAIAIASGDNHTCALLDDHSVKCWGGNHSGQLGLGDTADRGNSAEQMGDNLPRVSLGTGLIPIAIVAGFDWNCVLSQDHTVKCWGMGSYLALGTGDARNRGSGPGEMGDHLRPLDLGSGRSVRSLCASGYHACALLDDATVKCWGTNQLGQLGQGDQGSGTLRRDVRGRGDDLNEMGDHLPAIDLRF